MGLEVKLRCHSSGIIHLVALFCCFDLFCCDRFSQGPGTWQLGLSSWLANPRVPPISLPPLHCFCCLFFFFKHGCQGSNSVPYGYSVHFTDWAIVNVQAPLTLFYCGTGWRGKSVALYLLNKDSTIEYILSFFRVNQLFLSKWWILYTVLGSEDMRYLQHNPYMFNVSYVWEEGRKTNKIIISFNNCSYRCVFSYTVMERESLNMGENATQRWEWIPKIYLVAV